jgi:hypothetical protein
MTPAELLAQARRSLEERERLGLTLPATVTLVLPRRGAGGRVRLLGRRGGPSGRVLAPDQRGGYLASFDAQEIVAFLERHRAEWDDAG